MKNKATLFLALLAFAFNAAQAVPVSLSQAASAAAAWSKSGDALGVRLGSTVDKSLLRTVAVHDDVVFHVVPFTDGGRGGHILRHRIGADRGVLFERTRSFREQPRD